MIKNLNWLIEYINHTSHIEFESKWDFYIRLEKEWIYYDLDKYNDTDIPDGIIEEIFIKLHIDY